MSSGASAIERSVSALPDREVIVPTVAAAKIEALLLADGRALRVVADHPTDPLAEAPAEIATARERAERTFPPDWWLGGSHCGSHVQREERRAAEESAPRGHCP